jgi:peptidoglycan biosynthesis protein MviN/MurJ (putative lipid II flippase)
MISRATGLLRVLVIGAVMGPTYLANVFQAGYVLPANVFTVMAGPVLAMVVVPAITGAGQHAGEVLGQIAGRLLTVACACAGSLVLLSPLLAWTLVVGVPEGQRERAWLLTVVLILLVAPQVVLYTVASLGVAAQQARGRFALAAAAPAVESLGAIVTLLVVGWDSAPPWTSPRHRSH